MSDLKLPKLRRNPDGRAFVQIPKTKGKRKYFGKYGTKTAEAGYKAWVQQFLAGAVATDTSNNQKIINAVIEYLTEIKQTKADRSYKQYKLILTRYSDFMGPNARGSDINSINFRAYQKHVASQTYLKGGRTLQVTRARANNVSSQVKKFIRWACSHDRFPLEVWHRVQIVEPLKEGIGRETLSKKPISWEILQRTVPYLAPTIAAMCQVQFLCGMRPGEVCNLRRRYDSETQKGLDRVGLTAGGVKVWLYVPDRHKMSYKGQSLVKAVPPMAQDILERWENRGDCSDYFFSPRQALKDTYGWSGPWVEGTNTERDKVLSLARDHYLPTVYADSVQAGVKRAIEAQPDLPAWSPNQLRHGMATFIREKIGIEAAGIYAGHKNVDTTLIYASEVTKKLVGVAVLFEQALQGKQQSSD